MESFADRLDQAVARCGSPLMVGLDPRLDSLPESLRPDDDSDLSTVATAYRVFCREIMDAVQGLTAVVKPQAAFFEQAGPAGMQALWEVIQDARQRQLLVVLDGKRNDIGSTAEAYADAYLGESSAWRADALTVNPYLGEDGLMPFFDMARRRGGGVFVLVKTSNPGSGLLQDVTAQGKSIYRRVADMVEAAAAARLGRCGYGAIGAVVGATYPDQLSELRQAMPHAWLLAPGFGAQGGRAADVAAAFDARGRGAIVNSSRAIIFAHQRAEYRHLAAARWQDAVRAAAVEAVEQLRVDTPAGRLA